MTKVKHVKIPINPNIKAEPLTADSFGIGVTGSTPMDNSGPVYIPKLSEELRKRINGIRHVIDEDSTIPTNTLKNK